MDENIVIVEKLKAEYKSNLINLLNKFWDLFPEDVSDEIVIENLIMRYKVLIGWVPYFIKDNENLFSKTLFIKNLQQKIDQNVERYKNDLTSTKFKNNSDNIKSLIDMFRQHVSIHIKHMKNIIQNMKNILNNSSKDASKDDATLGIYAWPKQRLKKHVPYEKNTKEEELLYKQLYSHFQNNVMDGVSGLDEKGVEILKKMLANNEYPDIIREPNAKMIMRGMSVSDQELRNLRAAAGNDDFQGKKVKLKYSGIYIPKKSVSSWTTNKNKAIDFATNNIRSGAIWSIILYAQVSDNPGKLLQCDNTLYQFSFAESVNDEHEVIAMGNITTSAIEILK